VDGLVDSYMFWTVSDIFEESGLSIAPFTGKYGLVNFDGIPKPVFHAYRWLASLYSEEIPGTPDWCRVTRDENGGYRILAWNLPVVKQIDLKGADWEVNGAPRRETLRLSPVNGRFRISLERVDEHRGNALRAWQATGAPEYPDAGQVAAMREAARQTKVGEHIRECDGEMTITLDLPACGAVFCDIGAIG